MIALVRGMQTLMLLRLDGTVPISFKGNTYNIPITIGPSPILRPSFSSNII